MPRRVALITGASSGIGRAIALRLARDGLFVIINYRENKRAAEEVARAIKQDGGKSVTRQFDVSVRIEVETEVKKLKKELGHIDVLINNAAAIADKPIMGMKIENWEHVIDTNLTGVFHCTKAVVRTWAGKKAGSRIVNITSIAAEMGSAYQSNYCAAKGGVISFTKALARELAPKNITVNAVSPGLVLTEGTAHLDIKGYIRQIPLGRAGRPEEVAHLLSFLVSDRAAYITGQVIRINGGWYV